VAKADDVLTVVSQVDEAIVNGKLWRRDYQASTRTVTQTSPVGRVRRLALDDKLRVKEVQLPGVAPVAYGYDGRGRVTPRRLPDRRHSKRRSSVPAPVSSGFARAEANHVRTSSPVLRG
jgi:YD repeat-containing protein